MSGNKTDNGVHEVGTDDIRLTYQHDTPGQDVENYIKEQEKAFHEEKNRTKKHFSQVFGNPLQGYPHNEAFEVTEIKEGYFSKEFEDGEYIKGDEKMYVDIIKKSGGKNIKVYAPDRRDPQLSIEFDGGNLKKMEKELSKKGDGTEAIEEASTMSVDKKNMPKVKPMLQKLARARGVPVSFDKDGINVHFKGRDKDVEKLMKDIEKDKKLMKLMEVTDKEINAVKKLSKDMQSVLKGYQKITGMGDKELKDTKHNDTYKAVLTARDKVVTLIGTLQTGKLLKGESYVNEKQEVFENEAGLKKKAEKSGISLGILKQVYNRGLAAYKTGHRPGATAPQWAMARVNSFITKGKGTWGKADSDLADKVRGSKK